MVRKRRVIWSLTAQADRKAILNYWKKRNKSSVYPKKLRQTINHIIQQLLSQPHIGAELTKHIRKKTVNDYLIIYEFNDEVLLILSIFDTRQNPDKLDKYFL
ncbi:MAG TPA: type II toxin-antitoxin system RelE/ParE family toxin [Flavipsychrobacter sp.]|nr:type II toxin-antitoxin system RelE/ParE family toxin [Flavipsychrobacter sp.]